MKVHVSNASFLISASNTTAHLGEVDEEFRQRSRKEQRLPRVGKPLEDLEQLLAVAHLEQSIGLVEYDVLHRLRGKIRAMSHRKEFSVKNGSTEEKDQHEGKETNGHIMEIS